MQRVVHTLFRALGRKGGQTVLPYSSLKQAIRRRSRNCFCRQFALSLCRRTRIGSIPDNGNSRQTTNSRQKYWLFTPERSDAVPALRDRSTLLMQRQNPPGSIRPKAPGLDRLDRDQVVTCSCNRERRCKRPDHLFWAATFIGE